MSLLSKLTFKTRIILTITLATSLSAVVSIADFLYFNKQELYSGIVEKSQAIHLRISAAVKFVAQQEGLVPVIDRVRQKYKSHTEITEEDKEMILKQVPIVAGMRIGSMNSHEDNYDFRVFSDEPRNLKNKASESELKIFNIFKDNPKITEHIVNDGNYISVYKPVHLKKENGCLFCHGNPSQSPWGNGLDIIGYKMENWEDGKLHGVFEVKTNINELIEIKDKKSTLSPSSILIIGIVFSGILGVIVGVLIINKPVTRLSQLAIGLRKATEEVDNESTNIASSSDQLSQASVEQSASLQETSASIEEISKMISNNSDNSKRAITMSQETLNTTNEGKNVVESMILAIEKINLSNNGISNQIDETNSEIENIIKIINDIGQKTKVINDIVFQTKLLSFNASVEAARAGEAGKGFAVVAEEVGNLASMSGKASEEISQMLSESTKIVEDIVKNSKTKIGTLLNDGKEKVTTGTKIASECETTFSNILTDIKNITHMIDEISTATQEQSQGVSEINKAISQLDEVTHQNTANASTSAQSAKSLAKQANELNEIVQDLVKILNG